MICEEASIRNVFQLLHYFVLFGIVIAVELNSLLIKRFLLQMKTKTGTKMLRGNYIFSAIDKIANIVDNYMNEDMACL